MRTVQKTWLAVAAVSALLAGCGGDSGSDAPPPAVTAADAVYTNAKVLTVDSGFSTAEAFAVTGGKFVAVGTKADIQRYVDVNTQVIDLKGRTVIPGLSDNHFHAAVGMDIGLDLSAEKVHTLKELFSAITNYVKNSGLDCAGTDPATGQRAMFVSNSDWHEAQLTEQRTPFAYELEAAAPGCVVVLKRGGHSYFLSETALALWGYGQNTVSPPNGGVPKINATQAATIPGAAAHVGQLTGELVDGARNKTATTPGIQNPSLKSTSRPASNAAERQANILAEQKVINSYGLTNVRIPGTSIQAYQDLQGLEKAGKSTVRYSILFRGPTLAQLQAANIGPHDRDEWLQTWGIKDGLDGGFEGGYMTVPYENPPGQPDGYVGTPLVTQEDFNARAKAWNAAGWRMSVHSVGDAAMDIALQAYEQANAQKKFSTDYPWAIEHGFVVRDDQLPRMKLLNLSMAAQDHLYLAAPVLKRYLGMARASQITPVKNFLDTGLRTSGGTDSAVVPTNPFWVMYHFISRDTISDGKYGDGQGGFKDQRVSRETGLRMLTGYYADLTEDRAIKGSIERNKVADFVVLSADFMTVPEKALQDLHAIRTYVDGKEVYTNGEGL
jgi:predicted amidohydrolase YtcJ